MKYQVNNIMKNRLNGIDILEVANKHPLAEELQSILDSGIIQKDDLFLFNVERFYNNLGGSPYKDATGKEMWVNKFNVSDFVSEEQKDSDFIIQQGVLFGLRLQDKLQVEFPESTFKIIVSLDEADDAFAGTCTINFYTIRPNEIGLSEDLEGYKVNGLLVFET